MKFLIILSAFFALTLGQSDPLEVANDILSAQQNLGLAHDFLQRSYIISRNEVSGILHSMQERILEAFLNSYAEVKTTQLDTEQLFDDYESSFCKDAIRSRWVISVERHGQRLSQCLRGTVQTLNIMTRTLNTDHASSQQFSNGLQGIAINEIAQNRNFANDADIPRAINFAFRDRMLQALASQSAFEAFRDDLIQYQDNYVLQLTRCELGVVRSIAYDAIEKMRQAEACYTDDSVPEIKKKSFKVPV